jgi:hypothetical protein
MHRVRAYVAREGTIFYREWKGISPEMVGISRVSEGRFRIFVENFIFKTNKILVYNYLKFRP